MQIAIIIINLILSVIGLVCIHLKTQETRGRFSCLLIVDIF